MRVYSLGPWVDGAPGTGSEKAPVAPAPPEGPYAGAYGAGAAGAADGGGAVNLPNIRVNSPG
jgi:hypothetical protein